MPDIDSILEDFSFLDEWDDRYRYLIELGRTLEPFPEEHRTDANKVQGCVSQVWLWPVIGEGQNPIINFYGDSDAHIVRGLVAITLALYGGRNAKNIAELDALETFSSLGLQEHLTPQRANGLRSMIARIRQIATDVSK